MMGWGLAVIPASAGIQGFSCTLQLTLHHYLVKHALHILIIGYFQSDLDAKVAQNATCYHSN